MTTKSARGRALLASEPSIAVPWQVSSACVVAKGRSWVSVCPVSVPSRAAARLLRTHPFIWVLFSLQSTGSTLRQDRRMKDCAFIFIQCSQGAGSITQKNSLIINPCLLSKSGLSVPAWQSLLAAARSFEAVWIDMGWSGVWLQSATWYQPVFWEIAVIQESCCVQCWIV